MKKIKDQNFLYSILYTLYSGKSKGFTLVEILVAIAGSSILILAAVGYFFSILSQRDQALSSTIVSEQSETVFSVIGDAVRSAQSVAVLNGGSRLEVTGLTECWTFEYDGTLDRVNFGNVQVEPCTPPATATSPLNSSQADITSADFSLLDPDDSSRSIQMSMAVTAIRPLSTTSQSYERVFVNLIDE